MEKPAGSKSIYVAHYVRGQPAISQKHVDARGTISFEMIYTLAPDGAPQFLGPGITKGEYVQCRALMKQMLKLAEAMKSAGPFDPLALVDGTNNTVGVQQVLIMKMLDEYNTAVLIYADSVRAYLASPAGSKYRPDHAIDVYRQALGYNDLPNITRLVDKDGQRFQSLDLTPHQRECILDTMYHMSRRLNRRDAAFEYLLSAWAMRRYPERATVVMDEAAYYKKSDLIVDVAQYLESMGKMTPINLAQLAVAQHRLGSPAEALVTWRRLSTDPTRMGQMLTQKIGAFLGVDQA